LGLEEVQQTSSGEMEKDDKKATEGGVGGRTIHVEGSGRNGEVIEVEGRREAMYNFGNS
jgi:hypothetical protein